MTPPKQASPAAPLDIDKAAVEFRSDEYELDYQEAYETFLLTSRLGSKRSRAMALALLTVAGAVMTVYYALDPRRLDAFILAAMAILVFLAVVLAPGLRASSGAKAVKRARGTYRISMGPGFITTPDGERWPLKGDKKARAFETGKLFAMRPDRLHTFCLPKRILSEAQLAEVRAILQESGLEFHGLEETGAGGSAQSGKP